MGALTARPRAATDPKAARATARRTTTLAGSAIILAALGASCSRDPEIEERPVIVYSPRSFPIAQSDAYSVIYAGGDFEPSATRPPTAFTFLREVGRGLGDLPKETRSLVVDVSQDDRNWRGIADVPPSGPINVLVWPSAEACRLTRDVERRTDMTLAVVGRHFIVAGGRSQGGAQVPHTYVGDLTTGAIERLAFGLRTRRARPSITPFRTGTDGPSPALVAGGADPDSDSPLATAEIYSPKIGVPNDVGDFEDRSIDLSEARADHGATTLATGETLLVGGRGPDGPLRTMEVVDPVTRRARTAGVALLAAPRKRPTVLRLGNGEILVAGGFDAADREIATLEWFSPDASRPTKRPIDLVAGKRRAFVPLEAGGALAVVLPDDGATDFQTVWVISADGALEPGRSIDPATIDIVRLFPGADGAPVLWTGRRWLRWQPWSGAFEPLAASPDRGPSLDATASGDPGLALWLEDRGEGGMNATGFRFATRARFAAIPKPLLVAGTDRLMPDRLARSPGSSIRFEQERGLVLGPGASAFLTDVTFADFELEADVTLAAPTIVLRQESGEIEVGGADCAFAQAARQSLTLKRRGRRVLVSVDGTAERPCPFELAPGARVALGVRGSQTVGSSGVRNLRVNRR